MFLTSKSQQICPKLDQFHIIFLVWEYFFFKIGIPRIPWFEVIKNGLRLAKTMRKINLYYTSFLCKAFSFM